MPSNKCVLLILNGDCDTPLLQKLRPNEGLPLRLQQLPPWPAPSHIIAADGGATHLRQSSLHADVVLGDLDSASIQDLEHQRSLGSRILKMSDQESTDMEKCFAEIYELGATHVDIICWKGDRMDHMLCLIAGLTRHKGLTVRLVSSIESIWRLNPGQHFFKGIPGDRIGLAHFNNDPIHVSITGLKYNADKLELHAGCQAVSNHIAKNEFQVSCDTGPLYLIHMPEPRT